MRVLIKLGVKISGLTELFWQRGLTIDTKPKKSGEPLKEAHLSVSILKDLFLTKFFMNGNQKVKKVR